MFSGKHVFRFMLTMNRYKKETPPPRHKTAKTVLPRAPSGTRTLDTLIKSQVLYQLS